jgi:hypothetical protein
MCEKTDKKVLVDFTHGFATLSRPMLAGKNHFCKEFLFWISIQVVVIEH